MGNQPMQGIPPLLSKNWQPVPNQPNTFRNRLTHEYAHKHIVKVEEPIEIQSFKYRMNENNNYLCRVLYYHEYTDSIYHVYTDEMHIQPEKRQGSKWVQEKIKIIQTFKNLSELYGYTRVCRQMLGTDSNGNIKVWIHPDPVSPKVWSPCPTQTLMVADIQNVLQSIQELPYSKPLNKSYDIRYKNCSSFDQYIKEESKKIEFRGNKKADEAKSSNHFNNSTTNFNININIELDGKGKPIVKHGPQMRSSPFKQALNPVLCETKRKKEEEEVDYSDLDKSYTNQKKSIVKPHRPSTQYPFHKPQKIMGYYRTENSTKRRDSDFFKYPKNQIHKNQSNTNPKNNSAYPSVGKKYGESPDSSKHIEKNILGKLLNSNPKYLGQANNISSASYTKKASTQQKAKNQNDRPISTLTVPHKATGNSGKNINIPNFLAKRAVQTPQMKFRTCSSLEKYPQQSDRTDKVEEQGLELHLSPIEKNSNRENFQNEGFVQNHLDIMKDELNNILDMPIIKQPVISQSFENFKTMKAFYKPCPSREQDAEMQQIKEKVEKKKATFAHLKMEAMKILQDDF